nr:hypothetical protein [Propionibacterium sp.]
MKKKHTAVIGDDAHDLAQDIKADLAQLGTDAARLAGEVIAPRARDLADYVTPKVRDLATNVADYVQPRAKDLGERGVHLAAEARDSFQPRLEHLAADVQPKIARLAAETRESLHPYLEEARDRLQPRLEDARERLQPLVDEALARVEPLVEEGRDRLSHDVLPKLTDAYENVNALPQTKEAKKRLKAARAALAGDLTLPEPEAKRSLGQTLLRLVLAGGLLAGIVYAVKRFLAPEDSGWQPHEPSPAYRPAPTEEPAPEQAAEEGPRRAVTEPASPADEGGDPFVVSPYGEGSYVGSEPPADYVIKGNERSMKYHVQGSGGYDRTIADVWFSSEEAAQAAGFTKAQR